MNILEKTQLLCSEKGINPSKLETELGFGRGTISKWNKSIPSTDKLSAVADYFNVSIDWLLGKTEYKNVVESSTLGEDVARYAVFAKHDSKDVAMSLNFLLDQLENNDQDSLMFDGTALDDNTRELLKDSLMNSLKIAKYMSKDKE